MPDQGRITDFNLCSVGACQNARIPNLKLRCIAVPFYNVGEHPDGLPPEDRLGPNTTHVIILLVVSRKRRAET